MFRSSFARLSHLQVPSTKLYLSHPHLEATIRFLATATDYRYYTLSHNPHNVVQRGPRCYMSVSEKVLLLTTTKVIY